MLLVLHATQPKNGMQFHKYAVAQPTKIADALPMKNGTKILSYAAPMLTQPANPALDSRNGTLN